MNTNYSMSRGFGIIELTLTAQSRTWYDKILRAGPDMLTHPSGGSLTIDAKAGQMWARGVGYMPDAAIFRNF